MDIGSALALSQDYGRTFNFTTSLNSGSLTVLNKTNVANAVGIVLTSAFLAGTLVYTLEETRAAGSKLSNRLDSLFSWTNLNEEQQESDSDYETPTEPSNNQANRRRKKKKVDHSCQDCETYCTNKYYYGSADHPYDYHMSYTKRYVDTFSFFALIASLHTAVSRSTWWRIRCNFSTLQSRLLAKEVFPALS